jgi:hypothetical protein
MTTYRYECPEGHEFFSPSRRAALECRTLVRDEDGETTCGLSAKRVEYTQEWIDKALADAARVRAEMDPKIYDAVIRSGTTSSMKSR